MAKRAKPGLRYHKNLRKYYRWVDGKMIYFGAAGCSEAEAYAAYAQWCNPIADLDPLPNGKGFAFRFKPDATPEQIDLLADPKRFLSTLTDRIESCINLPKPERDSQLRIILHALLGVLDKEATPIPQPGQQASGFTLRQVFDLWSEIRKPEDEHKRATKGGWSRFAQTLKDCRSNRLTPDHIRQYIASLTDLSIPARKKHMAAVKLVLNFMRSPMVDQSTRAKEAEVSLPVDLSRLTAMLNVDPRTMPKPDKMHKTPFDPVGYKAILKVATDAKDWQFVSIWLLAANAGLNLTDFCRLVWDESLVLNHKTPHVHLSRKKKGEGELFIPLAVTTLEALDKYRQTLTPEKKALGVRAFNGNLTPAGIRDKFNHYHKVASVDKKWTYKHCRNIGPNVNQGINGRIEHAWCYLGQTAKFKEAEAYLLMQPETLLPLVKAIETEYFG